MEKHPLHIKIPELQKSEEVQDSVEKEESLAKSENTKLREEGQEGPLLREKLPNDAGERIESYMSRLENIFLNKDERVRERNLEMLRENIYDAFIIKPDEVPEAYFELQQQVARERGQAVENIPQNVRDQMIETLIKDQKHSLDNWIEYLTSEDATYPVWFKYFVFRNITKLSQFDKSLGKFKDRTPTTTAPYPDVFREPLAKICDIYEQVAENNKVLKTDPEIQREFSKSFPKLYAELITKSLASSMEGKEEIRGEWVKYSQGNSRDAEKLYQSLDEKGTGWCTAGMSTAETQIESGDFYVYYTYDKNNTPTQPRIAIRMNGTNEIGEVRGVLQHQALEPQMNEILESKLSEFGPEADKYKKKSEDMRKMTEVEKKTKENTPLTKEELEFLYEVNSQIDGFGYQKDPRIEEIRSQRNVKEDLPVFFSCEPNQIAENANEVNENTVVYVGKLYPNIFKQLPKNVEHVYTSFPENKVYIKEIEISEKEKSAEEYERELEAQGFTVGAWAKDILFKADLKQGASKKIKIIIPTVEALGFPKGTTREEIQKAARELGIGLKPLPARIGPELRLQYSDQPNGEYIAVDMENILDRNGDPFVFSVYCDYGKRWLGAYAGRAGRRWYSSRRWAFSQE